MSSIGADEQVPMNLMAGGEASCNATAVFRDPDAFMTEVNDTFTDPLSQDALENCPM